MATTPDKTIILITGANSGIGLELASQLLSKHANFHVLLGCRSTSKGTQAHETLQSLPNLLGTAEPLVLDVTSDASIDAAAKHVETTHGRLDILVNNAAIASQQQLSLREQMRLYFDTNATGPAILSAAFLPLLKKSSASPPRIINISSGGGSIARRLDTSAHSYAVPGAIPYRASKAALNMVTACQFVEYAAEGVVVLLFNPGFAVSNLGPQNRFGGGARPTREAVLPLVDVVEGKRDGEAGMFLHEKGTHPW